MPNVPDNPVEPDGLPDDHVDFLFSRLKSFSQLAVAVSGGADSLCLMVLLAEWQTRRAWPGRIDILTVDHGLRTESAAEADFVAATAKDLGLSSAVLHWSGPKPASNVQEEARRARYRLMAAHMKDTGAEALLLAHHLDDQAETFLDRLTRGSGVAGLSAMAADELDGPEGLRLVRPLLSVSKHALESSLRARGLTWCTDPSNRDRKYKRSRLRQLLPHLAQEGLTADRLAGTAANMRRADEALDAILHDLMQKHLVEHPAGPLKLDRLVFRSLPEELRLRMLSWMMSRVTGQAPRPRLRNLAGLDRMLAGDRPCRLTLCGAMFDGGPSVLTCWKEPGRRPPETLSGLSGSGIWDDRYSYVVPQPLESGEPQSLCLGPMIAAPLTSKQVDWPTGWPKAAFHCAPVVWTGGDVLLVPFLSTDIDLSTSRSFQELELERLPFQAKLPGNYVDDGNGPGEN
ncbi:tRNA lysidine(34) synthetase TilS [Roseibium sediminicola]|uniref:tRNA(Ile)-lysidine synthase n=1 Tax=Roseibium sediminicola TaxID=2933272 RepID=A0ABT0GUT8_9HYPH|nr:tRNA lysidine(34) synthetase TilS [Roseibium sp. CAU 1639]